MATLTIDLPEAPRAQAAYRLAADCPRCGAPLVLRQNRHSSVLFTGCSAYPQCAFTEPHDPRVQALATSVVSAVHAVETRAALAVRDAETRAASVRRALEARLAAVEAQAQAQVAAERAALARALRRLLAQAHPDRWPDTPLAHELTTALVALRDAVRRGAVAADGSEA